MTTQTPPTPLQPSPVSASLADAMSRRYGDNAGASLKLRGEWNETLASILANRSTRFFLEKPVAEADILMISAAAQSAGTCANLQTWSMVAVRDPDKRARMARLSGDQAHIEQAPLLLVFVADLSRLRALSSETHTPGLALDYFESFMMATIDATLAAQNAVLSATALGLGHCFIGSLRDHPELIAGELGLPFESLAILGLVIGYADPARPAEVTPRLPLSVILHREHYQAFDTSRLTAYDQVMAQLEMGSPVEQKPWSQKSAERIAGPDALGGRSRLLAAVRARGFRLK